MTARVLVTGAGGFAGHRLVGRLKDEGLWVRGVDRLLFASSFRVYPEGPETGR